MDTWEPDALQRRTLDRLDSWADVVGPRIEAAWHALARRLQLRQPGGPGYFLHPLALPTLQLPVWVARAAEAAGAAIEDEVLVAIVDAAAAGYLQVRVQDDLVDEGTGDVPDAVLLAQALHARHIGCLGSVSHSTGFWAHVGARWAAYSEGMLLERRLQDTGDGWDPPAFAAVLEQSSPLMLPPLAVVDHLMLPKLVEPVLRLVPAIARAHQLHVDLVDVEKDLANGNLTWPVVRFGGRAGVTELRRQLFFDGGFDRAVGEIGAALDVAADAARTLGSDPAIAWIEARRARLLEMRDAVLRAFFEALLQGDT